MTVSTHRARSARGAKWLSIILVVLVALIPLRVLSNVALGEGFPLVATILSVAVVVWIVPVIWFLRTRSRQE